MCLQGLVTSKLVLTASSHITPSPTQPARLPAAPAVRYVLVKADTLEAPTDSVLRSARRQLGEPSNSQAGADGQPTPASAARSRPLAPAAEAAAAAASPAPMPNSAMLSAMAKQLAKTVSEDGCTAPQSIKQCTTS